MVTVRIKSIGNQGILSNEEYKWIMRHLDTPLVIASARWRPDGELHLVTIRRDPEPAIVLFIDTSECVVTIRGASKTYYGGESK